jgi:hypothetical protein
MLPINSNLETMISKAIQTINFNCEYLFIVRKDQLNDIGELPGRLAVLDSITDGPATTVKLGIEISGINEGPIIVANSDQIMNWNSSAFLEKAVGYDGCVLTYKPDYTLVKGASDKNSFLEKSESGTITKFAEKIVLSDEALVGIHYYKSIEIFMGAYAHMKSNNIRAPNGEFYISNTYQSLLDLGKTVGSHALSEGEKYWPVGEPMDYFKYIRLNEYNIEGTDINNHYFDKFPVKYLKMKGDYEVDGIVVCTKGPDMSSIVKKSGLLHLDGSTEYCVVEVSCDLEGMTTSLENFVRGWFIGNFKPTLSPRTDFEVGICIHKKTEGKYDYHYHKEVEEFNKQMRLEKVSKLQPIIKYFITGSSL